MVLSFSILYQTLASTLLGDQSLFNKIIEIFKWLKLHLESVAKLFHNNVIPFVSSVKKIIKTQDYCTTLPEHGYKLSAHQGAAALTVTAKWSRRRHFFSLTPSHHHAAPCCTSLKWNKILISIMRVQ